MAEQSQPLLEQEGRALLRRLIRAEDERRYKMFAQTILRQVEAHASEAWRKFEAQEQAQCEAAELKKVSTNEAIVRCEDIYVIFSSKNRPMSKSRPLVVLHLVLKTYRKKPWSRNRPV